jgi:hypothetical protein
MTTTIWYLVCLRSGSVAVVQLEDVVELMLTNKVISAFQIQGAMGREFEELRARDSLCPRPVV